MGYVQVNNVFVILTRCQLVEQNPMVQGGNLKKAIVGVPM